ncbi:MarR family winged helix-turn-helix transcriptional regulator [Clostridium sp. JNZ X4-2]
MEDKLDCGACSGLMTHWLRLIYRNMTNLHNTKLIRYNLTTSQVGVLIQLLMEDGLTQKKMSQRLQIRPASITSLVNTLALKGWVKRKEDSGDARINRIYITEEGRNITFKCIKVNDEVEKVLDKDFSKTEKQMMLYWLKKLYKNLL